MSKFFVTTPIYYVNAKPHIGHVYSTIVADVLARYHRQKGEQVLFSTGTDENSQKNVHAAQKAGMPVQEYVDEMASVWKRTFDSLDVSYDAFVRTTSEEHKQAVRALIETLQERGDIYLGEYEGLYCVGCEDFVRESDLVDRCCPHHKTEPEVIKEKNYFFRLSRYRNELLRYYNKNQRFVQPESARNHMLYYIGKEMEDISISRQAQEWGIRMPQDPEHAVYVWVDALINYLTVAGYPDTSRLGMWWPPDVHVIGKDIIKFHCAIWPAMLMAAKLPLPNKVFAHGFFTVEGQKISKSLDNAIDPLGMIEQYPIDTIRYYLLREIPLGNDGDFSYERLEQRHNADLANGLGNLTSRTLNMFERYWSDADVSQASASLPKDVSALLHPVEKHIDALEFDKALDAMWEAIRWADGLIEEKKPWELAKTGDMDELQHTLTLVYGVLVRINEFLGPFMPETHKNLSTLLANRPLKKPASPLFQRIQS